MKIEESEYLGEFQTLGYNLRLLRERLGISQREAAQAAGIPVRQLELLEQGMLPKQMGINGLFRLCDLFHRNPADLMKRKLN